MVYSDISYLSYWTTSKIDIGESLPFLQPRMFHGSAKFLSYKSPNFYWTIDLCTLTSTVSLSYAMTALLDVSSLGFWYHSMLLTILKSGYLTRLTLHHFWHYSIPVYGCLIVFLTQLECCPYMRWFFEEIENPTNWTRTRHEEPCHAHTDWQLFNPPINWNYSEMDPWEVSWW